MLPGVRMVGNSKSEFIFKTANLALARACTPEGKIIIQNQALIVNRAIK
jgi:hypothetical protein